VNRPAIDDLLGSILSAWYESVAEWMPPGQLSTDTCSTCPESVLAQAITVADWPHDLMHQLATEIETAIAIIAESLMTETDEYVIAKIQEHRAVCSKDIPGCTKEFVGRELVSWSDDLIDVLSECVTPRIDEWISGSFERVVPPYRGYVR